MTDQPKFSEDDAFVQDDEPSLADAREPAQVRLEQANEHTLFDESTSERNAARRQETWLDTLNAARLWPVRVGLILGCIALLAAFVWLLYVVVFATVHFTIPQWQWASIEDLSWVKPVYSAFTNASAPVFLGMNA